MTVVETAQESELLGSSRGRFTRSMQAIGIFLFFGATMAALAGTTLDRSGNKMKEKANSGALLILRATERQSACARLLLRNPRPAGTTTASTGLPCKL